MRATRACAAFLILLLGSASVRAQDVCPTEVPASSTERRARAKEWFSRAEAAETANDPVIAVKAYQCSLHMVPHASTAFNLARLAEKTGDVELAIESYDAYLKLAPEAADREAVTAKIKALSERVSELRRAQQPDRAHTGIPVPTDVVPPTPDPGTSTASPPPRGPMDTEAPPGFGDTRRRPHPGVYVLGGVAVGAVVGGILLNLGARGKMDECRRLARDGQSQAATDACDAARPRAYTSYALFAAAGAAAVADAVWLLISTRPADSRLTLVPLSDGASLMARLRF